MKGNFVKMWKMAVAGAGGSPKGHLLAEEGGWTQPHFILMIYRILAIRGKRREFSLMVEGIPRFFQTRFLMKSFVLKFIEGFDLRKKRRETCFPRSPLAERQSSTPILCGPHLRNPQNSSFFQERR